MLDFNSNLRICFYYLPANNILEIIPELPLISWKSVRKNRIPDFKCTFPNTRLFYKKVPNSYGGFIYGLSGQFFINNTNDQVTPAIRDLVKNIDLLDTLFVEDIAHLAFVSNKKSVLEYLLTHQIYPDNIVLFDRYILPKDKYLIRKIDTKISIKKYLEKELYYFKQTRPEGFYYDMECWVDHLNTLLCRDQIN